MRRAHVLVLSAVMLLLSLLVGGGALTAQDATPTTTEEHPFVGTWFLDTDADDPTNAPEVLVVTADGGMIGVEANGAVTAGVWQATGERTADVTITVTTVDESDASSGWFVVRASIEVDADGDSFTAPYTFELVDPAGTGTGQYGPITATATRLTAEPMGTPVGPISELFEMSEEEQATPDAGTPAA